MKFSFFVVPIKKVEAKSGQGQNGEWTNGKYLVQVQNSEDQFVATAFNKNNEIMEANIGRNIDVTFDISCNEYQGKFYNNVNVSNINVPQDVPSSSTAAAVPTEQATTTATPVTETQSTFTTPEGENDLPF